MFMQPDPYFDAALEADLRDRAAEAAYWEAEIEKELAEEAAGRGWNWRAEWGAQPSDEHVRDMLRLLDAAARCGVPQ